MLDSETTANMFKPLFLNKDLNSNGDKHIVKCAKLQVFVDSKVPDGKVPDGIEFSIPQVSSSFIQQQLQNLKVNKATGLDDRRAKYLKLSAPVISQPLATILNVSIANGIYPDDLMT